MKSFKRIFICLIGTIFFFLALVIKAHYFKTLTLPDGYKVVRSFGSERFISPTHKVLFETKNKTEFLIQNEWILISSLSEGFSISENTILINRFSDEVLIFSPFDTHYKDIIKANGLIDFPNANDLSLDFYFDGIISSPEWIQDSNGLFKK